MVKCNSFLHWISFELFFYNCNDVSGGASKASDRCSFTQISENNKDWCNGRGKPLALRKVRGIVRFWKGFVRSEGWQGLRMFRSFEDSTPINFNPHRHGSE